MIIELASEFMFQLDLPTSWNRLVELNCTGLLLSIGGDFRVGCDDRAIAGYSGSMNLDFVGVKSD